MGLAKEASIAESIPADDESKSVVDMIGSIIFLWAQLGLIIIVSQEGSFGSKLHQRFIGNLKYCVGLPAVDEEMALFWAGLWLDGGMEAAP